MGNMKVRAAVTCSPTFWIPAEHTSGPRGSAAIHCGTLAGTGCWTRSWLADCRPVRTSLGGMRGRRAALRWLLVTKTGLNLRDGNSASSPAPQKIITTKSPLCDGFAITRRPLKWKLSNSFFSQSSARCECLEGRRNHAQEVHPEWTSLSPSPRNDWFLIAFPPHRSLSRRCPVGSPS